MSDVDERIEQLISRSLDGGLSEEEQLSLDRELIRDPSARAMMESYRAIDELAQGALAELASVATDADAVLEHAGGQTTAVAVTRPSRRGWLLIPGAIAAAILAMVIPKPSFEVGNSAPVPVAVQAPEFGSPKPQGRPPLLNGSVNGGSFRNVGNDLSVRRRAGTEWIGVLGDDGNVYWIEVERSRTIRVPRQNERGGGAFLEMR